MPWGKFSAINEPNAKQKELFMWKKVNVVVFDFDGTLSARDCNIEFARYCMKRSARPWLFSPLMLVCGAAKLVRPAGLWWRENIRRFMTSEMVAKYGRDFVKQHRKRRFDWAASLVAAERAKGNKVVLISAGPDYLVPHLVRDMKFDAVICSVMSKQNPWRYRFLCWGRNKVHALDEWARDNHFVPCVVRSYSDSKSDLPMMKIAREQIWVNRKTGERSKGKRSK